MIGTGSGIVPLFPVIDALSNKPILAIALYNSYHHAGGWSGFDNRACYPLDAEGLRNPGQGDPTKSDEMSDTYLSALPWGGYLAGDHQTVGVEPTGLVHDSKKIDLGGRSLKVMHVPGRDAGDIALWEAETGSLFTGHMLYDGRQSQTWPAESRDLYREPLAISIPSGKRRLRWPLRTLRSLSDDRTDRRAVTGPQPIPGRPWTTTQCTRHRR